MKDLIPLMEQGTDLVRQAWFLTGYHGEEQPPTDDPVPKNLLEARAKGEWLAQEIGPDRAWRR